MPRRHIRRPDGIRPLRDGLTTTEAFHGESFEVRRVAGGEPRAYRCPGCDQVIAGDRPHVVAWRAGGDGSDRRHWHTPCWTAREQRTVTRRWS